MTTEYWQCTQAHAGPTHTAARFMGPASNMRLESQQADRHSENAQIICTSTLSRDSMLKCNRTHGSFPEQVLQPAPAYKLVYRGIP